MKRFLWLLILLLPASHASSQVDLISWTGFKLSTSLDEKTKFEMKPIVRNNNDLSDFQNASLDLSINRKLGKGWYAQNLYRHWIFPDGRRVNFLWFDIGYVSNLGNSNASSGTYARLHWALDTGGQTIADFIRVKQTFRFLNDKKFVPTVAVEGWYRFTGGADFALYRIEPGFIWKIADAYALSFQYRIQRRESAPAPADGDHLVTTISYTF